VFLAECDVHRALEASDGNAVPPFSIMNSYGVLVRIKDRELEGMRKVADLDPRKVNPVAWPAIGKRLRVVSGAFQGLVVTVKAYANQHCLVEVEGGIHTQLKIPPFLLSDIEA